LELSKVPRLDLSESKLVELYNECPQILELTAIRVNLTADSYRQSDRDKIFLEKVVNGNYWVIATQNDDQDNQTIIQLFGRIAPRFYSYQSS
jgi:hypothetical protein